MTRLEQALNLEDFEALAKERMEPADFDFVSGGAWDEVTLSDNRAAFTRYRLRPRVLNGIDSVDTGTSILGTPVSMPVGFAPVGFQGLAHSDAEVATATVAAKEGALFVLAAMSSRSLEEVAESPPGPRWFQLYVHKDRGISKDLLHRAAESGYKAVVLTVDAPVAAFRERELRSGFKLPMSGFGNFSHVDAGGKSLISLITSLHDASLTWEDISWIRSVSGLPVVVKGILCAEDAQLAVEHGVSAVIVSNHGGRQLDHTDASIDALEEVVQTVAGDIEVYVDGGVRRGTDVVTALALGADAAFIGRPYLYALAVAGEQGVRKCIELLRTELITALFLLGVGRIEDIARQHVRRSINH